MPIITLAELKDYCSSNNISAFQAQKPDDAFIVTVPAMFSEDDNSADESAVFLKIKACHTGENLNGSNISKESMEKALPSFALRPVLASIVESTDADGNSSLDFNGHDMTIETDKLNPDEQRINYIERIVGVVSPEDLYMEEDAETGNSYVYATGIVYKDYTYAADILERRKVVDVSVELAVNKFSFDAKRKILNIEDFTFSGITLLGSAVNPGMAGAHAELQSFSSKEPEFMARRLEELEKAVKKFETLYHKATHTKGGENLTKFEELLAKYNVTEKDVPFEYSNLTDEELESKFKEAFAAEEAHTPFSKKRMENSLEIRFEISHEDIKYALYSLISEFEELDNEWYYICAVYDTYFAYENWSGGKIWGQNYTKDGDTVALDGERYELFRELLTASEKNELEAMRSNYSALQAELSKYQEAELHAQRKTLLSSEDYSMLFGTPEYKDLYAAMDNYSVDELKNQLVTIAGQYVLSHKPLSNQPVVFRSNKISLFSPDPTTEEHPFKTIFTKDELDATK